MKAFPSPKHETIHELEMANSAFHIQLFSMRQITHFTSNFFIQGKIETNVRIQVLFIKPMHKKPTNR